MKHLAIVCAYRKEETDLDATLADAQRSGGGKKGCTVYAVEDKDMSGPGWNRHRGIDTAKAADVVCIIDAHMRFQGDVLRRVAGEVRAGGGLVVPLCHHNPLCAFDGAYDPKTGMELPGFSPSRVAPEYQANSTSVPIPSGGGDARGVYAGARMIWKDVDRGQHVALAAKWRHSDQPGPCTAVMGACYVFRREWYYRVGQPLSVLCGWGCDEELLSIAAWLSGEPIRVDAGHVAHRYRAAQPFAVPTAAKWMNRLSLVQAVVADPVQRAGLLEWTRQNPQCPTGAHPRHEQLNRLRSALLNQRRTWAQWVREACEPPEADGKIAGAIPFAVDGVRPYVEAKVSASSGYKCTHCGNVEAKPETLNTYENSRRYRCGACTLPYIVLNPSPAVA